MDWLIALTFACAMAYAAFHSST